jgi:hypothetical protein
MAVLCTDDASCVFAGLLEADDGTRTHDLLHGKCSQPFAPIRARSLKPQVCSDFEGSQRTEAKPSERGVQPLQPL